MKKSNHAYEGFFCFFHEQRAPPTPHFTHTLSPLLILNCKKGYGKHTTHTVDLTSEYSHYFAYRYFRNEIEVNEREQTYHNISHISTSPFMYRFQEDYPRLKRIIVGKLSTCPCGCSIGRLKVHFVFWRCLMCNVRHHPAPSDEQYSSRACTLTTPFHTNIEGMEAITLKHLVCIVLCATLNMAYMDIPTPRNTTPPTKPRRTFAWIVCCTIVWFFLGWGSFYHVFPRKMNLLKKWIIPETSGNCAYSRMTILQWPLPTLSVYYVAITWSLVALFTVFMVDWLPAPNYMGDCEWSHLICGFVFGSVFGSVITSVVFLVLLN